MTEKKTNGRGHTDFFARLPKAVYCKLRALAGQPPVSVRGARKAALLRLPTDSYRRLRVLALEDASHSGEHMSMTGQLARLIDQAKMPRKVERVTLSAAAAALIAATKPEKRARKQG